MPRSDGTTGRERLLPEADEDRSEPAGRTGIPAWFAGRAGAARFGAVSAGESRGSLSSLRSALPITTVNGLINVSSPSGSHLLPARSRVADPGLQRARAQAKPIRT